MTPSPQQPRARILIIAGHDPSGGAGVDADRESVSDLDIETVCVVTAFTDQDQNTVRSIGPRPPREWLREAFMHVLGELGAVKFGLLPGADHVFAARDLVRALRERHGRELPIVVDPVLSASSGARFLDREGAAVMRHELLSEGVIVTPNLPEAAELANLSLHELRSSLDARHKAAKQILASGARAVIVKGGHGSEDPVRDLVAIADGRFLWHTHPRIAGGKIRGSGCRFATRLAASMALGATLEAAAEAAGLHVAARIEASRVG